jgi:hypothetical protein
MMHDEITKAMAEAAAAYTGPVTLCRPGRARGQRIKPKNEAVQWLIEHRDNPAIADPKVRRRRVREHYAQQQCIAERNTPILERIGKQERRAAFNQAVMHRLNEQQRQVRPPAALKRNTHQSKTRQHQADRETMIEMCFTNRGKTNV